MDRAMMIAELGSGGMADVFLAMRRGMGGFVKLVVIKRLRKGAMEGDAITMFRDEARISARLNHPNVVQTHEVGFDGEHYRLEMEYLDGQPLHRITHRAKKAGRSIEPGVAVALIRDVLAGLHYAHELADYDGSPLGIVHRDVSPQNIFVTYDGRVKLVDFGIAKMAGQIAVTQVGMVKGKVRYMAPEQATARPIDCRADVFAAGVVLWQLLVGSGYWGDCPDLTIFHRLSIGDLPPGPRSANPAISAELDRVCARALAVEPNDRYATAGEFYDALEAHLPAGGGADRAMGTLASELFTDVRQAIRAAIEKAAARPSESEIEASADRASSREIRSLLDNSEAHSATLRADSERPVTTHTTRAPEPKRALVTWLAAGLALAAAALAVPRLMMTQAPSADVGARATTSAAPAAPAAAPGALGAPAAPADTSGSERAAGASVGTPPREADTRSGGGSLGGSRGAARATSGAATRSGGAAKAEPERSATNASEHGSALADAGAPIAPAAPASATVTVTVKPKIRIEDGDPWDAGRAP
jgi:serine/threonine protein kinase